VATQLNEREKRAKAFFMYRRGSRLGRGRMRTVCFLPAKKKGVAGIERRLLPRKYNSKRHTYSREKMGTHSLPITSGGWEKGGNLLNQFGKEGIKTLHRSCNKQPNPGGRRWQGGGVEKGKKKNLEVSPARKKGGRNSLQTGERNTDGTRTNLAAWT